MGTVTQRNLAHVQAQLGGANPISLSEYYRGGAYVPSLRNVIVYEPAGGGFTFSSGSTFWANYYNYDSGTKQTYYNSSSIYWSGVLISEFQGENTTTLTVGSYTYYRGSSVGGSVYQIRRTSISQVSINTGVPSSGAISLNQLLGAENP